LKLKDLLNDKNASKAKNIASTINPVNQFTSSLAMVQKPIVATNTSFQNVGNNLMSKPRVKPTTLKGLLSANRQGQQDKPNNTCTTTAQNIDGIKRFSREIKPQQDQIHDIYQNNVLTLANQNNSMTDVNFVIDNSINKRKSIDHTSQ